MRREGNPRSGKKKYTVASNSQVRGIGRTGSPKRSARGNGGLYEKQGLSMSLQSFFDRNGEQVVDRNGEQVVDRNGEQVVDRNGEQVVDRNGEQVVDRGRRWL